MKYSTKLGDQICEATASSSKGLRHICEKLGIPYSTVTGWVYDPQHEMYNKYMQAKQAQLYHLTDELYELLDDHSNDYMEVVKNGKKEIVPNRQHLARTRLRVQGRISIITKLAPILYKIKPEKRKHRVIMAPPPAAPAPAPKPAPNESKPTPGTKTINQSTDQQIDQHYSPKTTRKYLPDGTYEDYNEHGNLIRKSCKPYNPKPHHQGFW